MSAIWQTPWLARLHALPPPLSPSYITCSRQPQHIAADLHQTWLAKSHRFSRTHLIPHPSQNGQVSSRSYVHSSSGTSLYLILVGCLSLAGRTFRMYRSPTLIVSYLGSSPSSTQQGKTSRSRSGSGVRKNGREYLSRPVLFLTRCTVAWNLPLDCLSRYWPTLQTKVPGFGGASTQMPSWLRTSRAGTESWRTSVSPGGHQHHSYIV